MATAAERAAIIAAAEWMAKIEHAAWLEWSFGPIGPGNRFWVMAGDGPRPWRGGLQPGQVHLINCLEEIGAYEWEPPLPDQRPHARAHHAQSDEETRS